MLVSPLSNLWVSDTTGAAAFITRCSLVNDRPPRFPSEQTVAVVNPTGDEDGHSDRKNENSSFCFLLNHVVGECLLTVSDMETGHVL